jgi:hypothetical protein
LITDNTPFNATISGTYTVTGTDANFCSDTATAMLTVNALPVVSASPASATVCSGDPLTLSGSGAITYSWSGPETVSDNTPFNATVSGTYTVTGTDANSCTDTATVPVTVNALPNVTASPSTASVCAGDSLTLSGSGAMSYTWTGPESVTDNVAFIPTVSGTYVVTGTDANACTDTATATVTVNTLPNVTVSLQDTACTTDPAFTLSGTPAGGTFSGPGVSGSSFSPSTAGTGSHTITYVYTDVNGCSNQATDNIVVDPCVGIEAVAAVVTDITIYPNPSGGMITLELGALNNATATVRVMNAMGQVIREEKTNESRLTMDLGTLANGVYFIHVSAEGFNCTKQVILNK